ncbi:MAG TPA: hypothetical protein VFC31_00300 [Candidatus Limnocylindria bacterium]|nr:hypothetical protein [Candidatus Limnocylindria bacterium]
MKVTHDFVVYPIGEVSKEMAAVEDLEPGKAGGATLTSTPGTCSTFVHRDMGQRVTFPVAGGPPRALTPRPA